MSNAVMFVSHGLALLLVVAVCGLRAQAPPSADDWVKRGIQAYKANKYPEAQRCFENAVALQPNSLQAQLYLATAYLTQWVPGVDSAQNQADFQQARAHFLKVLDLDPKNKLALASLASLEFNSAIGVGEDKQPALERARQWNLRRTQVDPNDSEAFYYLGVIGWSECFPAIQQQRTKVGLRPDDPGPLPDDSAKVQLQIQCEQKIEQAIRDLQHVIDLDPAQEDAMAYLNLNYRLKANLVATKEEARSLIQTAEEWSDKSLDAKRKKAQRRPQ